MAESPKILNNNWLSGPVTPPSCSTGNSPDFLNTGTNTLFTCLNDVYVPIGSGTSISQTPWIQNIDGGGFTLTNVGGISVNGNINITGQYLINGVPVSGSQTPWVSNINGAGFSLANANNIGANGVQLSTPAGTGAFLTYNTATFNRWTVSKNTDPESGGNAGSNFAINRYSDAGTFLGTPFFINRATGLVTVANGLTLSGGNLTLNGGNVSVTGNIDATGSITINGVPIVTLAQTPWLQNINGAGFNLNNAGIITSSVIHALSGPSYFTGRVGIGTTTPGYPLDVVGDVNISGVYRINGVPITTGGGTPGGTNTQVQYNNAGAFGADQNFTWDKINLDLTVQNVGVTQAPLIQIIGGGIFGGELILQALASETNVIASQQWGSGQSGPPLIAHGLLIDSFASRGSQNTPFPLQAGDQIFKIFAEGNSATSPGQTNSNGASIQAIVETNWTTINCATALLFSTNATPGSAETERMRVTSVGRVGIGNPAPGFLLDVSGDINTTGVYRINGVPISFVNPIVVAGGAFSGGGSALVGGTSPGVNLVYCVPVIKACTATSWTVTVDGGTAGIRLWRIGAGTAVPTVANSITTADLAISTGTNLKSTSFANFTGGIAPTFAIGDIIAIQLNTVTTATYVAFSLVAQ